MTSASPTEASYFRGKTLTPESPVPVHIPEPQNIPVLMNQNDLQFNNMSTHMEQRYPPQNSAMAEDEGFQRHLTELLAQETVPLDTNSSKADENTQFVDGRTDKNGGHQFHHDNALAYEGDTTHERQDLDASNTHLTTDDQPSVPSGYDKPSKLANDPPTSFTLSQSQVPSPNTDHVFTTSIDHSQEAPVSQGPGADVPQAQKDSETQSQASSSGVDGDFVNYQSLLDNLSPSTSVAPISENATSTTTAASLGTSSTSSVQTPIATLPVPLGLPPRPPPQEKPAIHPNYTPGEDIRSYHNPPAAQNSNASTSYNAQSSNTQRPPQGYVHNNGIAPNGMPPPPLATFQQPITKHNQTQSSPQEQQYRQREQSGRNQGVTLTTPSEGEDGQPRSPDIERLYEEFLRDEAIYVAEGTWDRFPQGSRLFVGNLFTEKVSKRDIFHVFQKYGRLAQISMKSAYGFVQYHDAGSCMRALQSEQGIEIRGRKIHLEISKPQKNTRNAAATAAGDNLRAGQNRRSRSPDYTRGGVGWQGNQRPGGDRFDRHSLPFQFERRARDDYRPGMRSPSPRGFRGRDNFRGPRSPDRYYRGRSRSPYGMNEPYKSRSPRGPDPDDEANLPIPRRNPRDVPDVQMILVEDVDRTFVGYIQQSFRERGLRCEVVQMPRVSLTAMVKRQVVEGVQAVVKIVRKSQNTGKIPLQVYNRSSGADNVRFDDYEDLNANVAAELVVRAKITHMAPAPPIPQQYPPASPYGVPQYQHNPQQLAPSIPPHQQQQQQQQQQQPPQSGGSPPNLAHLITSLDGPALQKLLGAMSQTPQTPLSSQQQQHTPQQMSPQPDLSALLQRATPQQQSQHQGYQYGVAPSQQHSAFAMPTSAQSSAYGSNAGFPPQGGNYGGRPPQQSYPMPPQQQQQPVQQHNVQDMLAQLARYK